MKRKTSLYLLTPVIFFAILFYGFLFWIELSIYDEPGFNPAINPIDLIYDKFETLTPDRSEYIWPTNASQRITSTFAEFRNTHFHGGIDISTNNQNGYKVFAVREGYVARIRILPNGYGKMLYVKHPDGYYSTYSHLKTFNKDINLIAKAEQYRTESYFIELTLDSAALPVSKGDVIAYTGDTGTGPPHLHFEIRDENFNLVNPFHFENLYIREDIPPIIKKLFVAPYGINSSIFGKITPHIFNNNNRGLRSIKIPRPIYVTGNIRMGIETIDLANEASNRSGIYSIELFLKDSLIYSVKFDRIPADHSKQILLHYDLPLLYNGDGKFQKLYVEEGNLLPIYNRLPYGSGIINTNPLNDGLYPFKIVVKDFSDNKSEIKGNLLVNNPPEIHIEKVNIDEIILKGDDLNLIEKCFIYGKVSGTSEWKKHTLNKGVFQNTGTNLILPVELKRYNTIKIIAENEYGSVSAPVYYHIKKLDGSNYNTIKITKEHFYDFINITLSTAGAFTDIPQVDILEGSLNRQMKLKAIDLNKYTGSFIPSVAHIGKRVINVIAEINGRQIETKDSIDIYPILHNNSGYFSIDNGNVKISYDSGAVFKTLFMMIDSSFSENKKIFSFSPQDILLNKGIRIFIKQNNINEGIYIQGTRNWNFQTSAPEDGYLSALLTRTLTDVTLLEDNQKPFVSKLNIKTRNQRPYISFRYGDDLSGINYDRFRMYINDRLVIPEIDGENKRIWYEPEEIMTKGNHNLRIEIYDKAGNNKEISTNFRIQ